MKTYAFAPGPFMRMALIAREEILPFIRLCKLLDGFIAVFDQPFHIFCEVKSIEPSAHGAIGRHRVDHVDHDSTVFAGLEMMLMFQYLKISLCLLIDKDHRLFHFGDLASQQSCFK